MSDTVVAGAPPTAPEDTRSARELVLDHLVDTVDAGPQTVVEVMAATGLNRNRAADSGRSRPPFRDEAAHHSEMIPPTVPR